MRVMHVTDSFPPYGFGGTKYYLRDLVQEQSRRHKVSVVFRRRQSSDREIISREQGPYMIHEFNFPRGKPDVFSGQGQALFSQLVAKEKPDVLHFHSFRELPYSLVDVANANGIPCVYTLHDFSLICPALSLARPDHALCSGHVSGFECFDCHTGHQGLSRVEQAKQLPLMPRYLSYQKQGIDALRKFDLILCPTDFAAKKLSEFGPLGRDRMQTVRFGRTLSPRMRFKSIGEVLRFGFIGGLVPDKGIELLLQAFREVKRPDAQLDIYGNGEKDYEAHLAALAGNAPINFLGTFDRTYIDRVFEHLDVFILPTLAQETTSLVLLEAIACGVPVIVPDAGGLPEIVKHYNAGLVFEYNNADSLAEKIESCAENPQMVEQLSRQMPPIPSLEAHARELEEVYAGLLRK